MRMAVMIALVGPAATIVIAALPFPAVDMKAVLRFIAPTAFETRPIEVIIESGCPE